VLSAEDAAVRTIHEHENLKLNESARAVFVNALLEAPAPGRRLAAAAKRYKQRARL